MSIAMLVRRVSVEEATNNSLGKGFILEFVVEDPYSIHVNLLTDKDPTMVATDTIEVSSETFIRNATIDEPSGDVIAPSIEDKADFAARAFEQSKYWAIFEIEKQRDAAKLVDAIAAILPPSIEVQ